MGDLTPIVTTEITLLCRARICAWLVAAALVAGCGAGGGDTRVQLTQMPEGLAGVYAGEFPCLNCEAIAATLWLRTDERFFLKQTYRGGAPGASGDAVEISDTSAYAMGRWLWDEQAALIVLDSPGPQRRLSRLDEQRLQLQPSSKVEHLLTRDPAAPPFTDRVRIDGESAIVDGNGVFKECLSGLSLPIVKNNAFGELRRVQGTRHQEWWPAPAVHGMPRLGASALPAGPVQHRQNLWQMSWARLDRTGTVRHLRRWRRRAHSADAECAYSRRCRQRFAPEAAR
jgi:hypothetical protein